MSHEPTGQDPSKPSRIHTEEVKQRHVSHWDLDYLPTEEVEAAHERSEPELPPSPGPAEPIQVADDYDFIPKEEYDKTAAKKAHKTSDE